MQHDETENVQLVTVTILKLDSKCHHFEPLPIVRSMLDKLDDFCFPFGCKVHLSISHTSPLLTGSAHPSPLNHCAH